MQGLSSSALGAPVESQAASDAVDRQHTDFDELRRAAVDRLSASQRHRMGVMPGMISPSACAAAPTHFDCYFCIIKVCLCNLDSCPAGHKDSSELRTVDLHKTGLETKKLIVQQALSTEDMDQERFLTKVRQRMDRCEPLESSYTRAHFGPHPDLVCCASIKSYSCQLAPRLWNKALC